MSVFDLERLLQYGYFPKELPPCFCTRDIAVQSTLVIKATECINPKLSIPLVYSGFKSETARRKFAIPNPYHFCKAAAEVVNGEDELIRTLDNSKYSLRAPIAGKPAEGNSFAMKSQTVAGTRKAVEQLYQNNQVEIRLDINAFFDSVYTHAIPWAIHGVTTAKKRRRDVSLLGNRLDSCMQAMNYGQTNGILIGNDLSRIASEIILCTVDEQIQNKFPTLLCKRFVDDYYIYAKDTNDVKQIIAFIRKELAKYQLSLNENKIQVNESPFVFNKPWYIEMKKAASLNTGDFLSWLINEYNKEKDPALLKYGLKVISIRRFTIDNSWKTIQSRILNIWVRYPFLAEQILPLLWNNKDKIRKRDLKNAIYSIIEQSLLLGHDLEVVWATWFIKVFDIQISQEFALKVLRSDNDLAIIIMFDILESNGLVEKTRVKKEYQNILERIKEQDKKDDGSSGELPWSSHWLLAYEIEREQRFRPIGEKLNIMDCNPFFMKLLRKDIKFYDPNYRYSDSEDEEKRKQSQRKEKLYEFIESNEFQEGLEKGNQEFAEQLITIIDEIIDTY